MSGYAKEENSNYQGKIHNKLERQKKKNRKKLRNAVQYTVAVISLLPTIDTAKVFAASYITQDKIAHVLSYLSILRSFGIGNSSSNLRLNGWRPLCCAPTVQFNKRLLLLLPTPLKNILNFLAQRVQDAVRVTTVWSKKRQPCFNFRNFRKCTPILTICTARTRNLSRKK